MRKKGPTVHSHTRTMCRLCWCVLKTTFQHPEKWWTELSYQLLIRYDTSTTFKWCVRWISGIIVVKLGAHLQAQAKCYTIYTVSDHTYTPTPCRLCLSGLWGQKSRGKDQSGGSFTYTSTEIVVKHRHSLYAPCYMEAVLWVPTVWSVWPWRWGI